MKGKPTRLARLDNGLTTWLGFRAGRGCIELPREFFHRHLRHCWLPAFANWSASGGASRSGFLLGGRTTGALLRCGVTIGQQRGHTIHTGQTNKRHSEDAGEGLQAIVVTARLIIISRLFVGFQSKQTPIERLHREPQLRRHPPAIMRSSPIGAHAAIVDDRNTERRGAFLRYLCDQSEHFGDRLTIRPPGVWTAGLSGGVGEWRAAE